MSLVIHLMSNIFGRQRHCPDLPMHIYDKDTLLKMELESKVLLLHLHLISWRKYTNQIVKENET